MTTALLPPAGKNSARNFPLNATVYLLNERGDYITVFHGVGCAKKNSKEFKP